ncbi:MAG: LysM peptidoglycan-binding domain-containing protein [Phycisphaerae bacterium]|nr:LysM peptidoglycan-binding domain-containing protein [Phycisphaerae bacterium]
MTRENKLALVLGFGLMLFVGILVSDHFAARKNVPLAAVPIERQDSGVPPIPGPGAGDQYVRTGEDGAEVLPTPPTQEDPPVLVQNRETPAPPVQPTKTEPDVRTYVVREGDTLAAIAGREYGRRSLGQKLAEYNKVNPAKLKSGASIQIPPVELLDPTAAPVEALATNGAGSNAENSAPVAPKFKVYKVREGDTLYGIAQRELGKGDRWKELQSSNVDVLKSAADLTPGMQIKIPVVTASAQRSADA